MSYSNAKKNTYVVSRSGGAAAKLIGPLIMVGFLGLVAAMATGIIKVGNSAMETEAQAQGRTGFFSLYGTDLAKALQEATFTVIEAGPGTMVVEAYGARANCERDAGTPTSCTWQ